MESLKYHADLFADYLYGQSLSERSVSEHLANLERFSKWVEMEGLSNIRTLNYNEIMGYVQYEKARGLQVQTINIRMNSLTKFYEHLKKEGYIETNPAKRIRVKGAKQTILKNTLTMEQMEYILNTYAQKSKFKEPKHKFSHQRNITMLGLIIYQGATTGEFKNMQTSDIRLESAKVYIPGTGRSSGRKLDIHPTQMLVLNEYLKETRSKLSLQGEKLFSGNLKNLVWLLFQELKEQFPEVDNINQFKSSVLMHWLKLNGKRKAQYMIGHKYISSTEKYEVQNLDSLKEGLCKHHPFG